MTALPRSRYRARPAWCSACSTGWVGRRPPTLLDTGRSGRTARKSRLVDVSHGVELARVLVRANSSVKAWSEQTITWDTKPPCGQTIARWSVSDAVSIDFDVTKQVRDALAGDKRLALRIFAPQRKRGSDASQR